MEDAEARMNFLELLPKLRDKNAAIARK